MGLLAGLIGGIGKVVTGVKNLIINAKTGKAAIASGFIPGATTTQAAVSTTTGAPTKDLPWYKQPWVIPAAIGGFLLLVVTMLMMFSGRRR